MRESVEGVSETRCTMRGNWLEKSSLENPVFFHGIENTSVARHHRTHLVFYRAPFFATRNYLRGVFFRKHDHSVTVAYDQVAWIHFYAAAVYLQIVLYVF